MAVLCGCAKMSRQKDNSIGGCANSSKTDDTVLGGCAKTLVKKIIILVGVKNSPKREDTVL